MAAPELPGVSEIGIEQGNHSHGRRGEVGASSGIATFVRRPRGNHTGVRESGAISTFRNRWLYPLRQLLLWDLRHRDDAGGSDLTAGGDPHEVVAATFLTASGSGFNLFYFEPGLQQPLGERRVWVGRPDGQDTRGSQRSEKWFQSVETIYPGVAFLGHSLRAVVDVKHDSVGESLWNLSRHI